MSELHDGAALSAAIAQVRRAHAEGATPHVQTYFDETTHTATHVVYDLATRRAAIIDSVLDFDPAAGRASTASADRVVEYVAQQRLVVDWLLETHAHADHLTAANVLRSQVGGKVGISRSITRVQVLLDEIFNFGETLAADGSAFDHLFEDGEGFAVGDLPAMALHVPGHTPADAAYVIGDLVFVGDTIFMPDWGTARADFPGADPHRLYASIRRLLAFPDDTRLYLCHDYKPPGRDEFQWITTVGEQRASNVHVRDGVDEATFVTMRTSRDAGLAPPRLILPSLQVNIRAGRFPEPESNGRRYLKLPLDVF
jgi:glyoxylase-like metal-dependent hydrolase (beta-lactamase superfamily II)